jgi:bifunctional DNA-binding transcriptional regulator/antitoxin component of YhaV-PrlF toxin-antitoxin module
VSPGRSSLLDSVTIKEYYLSVITRITGKNQVTVPAEIVRKARLSHGTRLEWRLTDREDVLEVRVLPDQSSLAHALRGRGRKSLRKRGSAVDRLIAERRRENSGRTRK